MNDYRKQYRFRVYNRQPFSNYQTMTSFEGVTKMRNQCTIFLFLSSSSRGTAKAEIIPLLMFRMVVVSPSSGYNFTPYTPSTITFRGYLKRKGGIFSIFKIMLNVFSYITLYIGVFIKLSLNGNLYLSISAAKASELGAGLNTGLPCVSMSTTSLRLQPVVRTLNLQA